MLLDAGVPMAPKPFAIGVRIEHSQAAVSEAQFGPAWERLPAADYKLACHLPGGRSASHLLRVPRRAGGGRRLGGGPAGDQRHEPARPGRSQHQRRLSGGGGARRLRLRAPPGRGGVPAPGGGGRLRPGGGGFRAPAQTVGDFLAGRPSKSLGDVAPTYRPGVTPASLDLCLPDYVTDTLRGALPLSLTGSSVGSPTQAPFSPAWRPAPPLRYASSGGGLPVPVRGLYPCGEGAGYAGGITSAAVDGIRVAEAVAAG